MMSLQRDKYVCCFSKNLLHSYVKFFMLQLQHIGATDSIFGILLIIHEKIGVLISEAEQLVKSVVHFCTDRRH